MKYLKFLKRTFILFMLSFFATNFIMAQSGEVDLSFNPSDAGFDNPVGGANNIVKKVVYQSDGKLLIGGQFTTYNGIAANRIARINEDGSIDPSFNAGGSGFNNLVKWISIQNDGKIIVAGYFTTYNGLPVNYVVRLDQNGAIDPSFTATVANTVNTLCIQPDGKIIVGANNSPALSRLNTDGTRDVGFNALVNSNHPLFGPIITTICLQPDGKIIAAGSFSRSGGTGVANMIRVEANGLRDASFQGGADSYPEVLFLQPDGKILVGGSFYPGRIKRLNADGTKDASFNANENGLSFGGYVVNSGFAGVYAISLQTDGKIILGGVFKNYNGNLVNNIVRLNSNGSLDYNFNINGNSSGDSTAIYDIALQPNEKKIIIAGSFKNFGTGRNRIARLYNCTATKSITNVPVCAAQLPYSWNGNMYATPGTYTKTLINATGCDSIATLVLSIGASNIFGPDRACGYTQSEGGIAAYTISAPAGSAITWSVSKPSSMLIINGQGTNAINIQYTDDFISGTIYAKVVNTSCNYNIKPSFSVSRSLPSSPAMITQQANVACVFLGTDKEIRFTVRKAANALSYNWTAQAGTTTITHTNGEGINDTTVTIKFAANFTASPITVQSVNACGVSAARSKIISLTPTIPGPIVANNQNPSGCPRNIIYRLSPQVIPDNATQVIWEVPAGGTIINGQGDAAIVVAYNGTGAISGFVSARASGGCTLSSVRKLAVNLPVSACAKTAARNLVAEGDVKISQPVNNEMAINVYPNPSSNNFNLQVTGAAKEQITYRITDIAGRFINGGFIQSKQNATIGAGLKMGIYILEVRQGKEMRTTKLVKQ